MPPAALPAASPKIPPWEGTVKRPSWGAVCSAPGSPMMPGRAPGVLEREAPRRSVREIPRFLEFIRYCCRLCFLALNIQTTDLLKSGQGPLSGSRGRRSWLLCADASLPGPSRSPPPPILLRACRAHRGREGWPPQPSLCAPKGRPWGGVTLTLGTGLHPQVAGDWGGGRGGRGSTTPPAAA